MLRIAKIICFVVIALMFVACTKKKVELKHYNITIPQVIWDYGYFKKGTYWIYKDSVRNITDSIWVTNDIKGTNIITEKNNFGYTGNFEFYAVSQFSLWKNASITINVNQEWAIKNGASIIWKACDSGETILMDDKFISGHKLYPIYPGGEVNFINYYSNYNMDNIIYSDVVCWENIKDASENNNHVYYYIAKNIGTIKKVLVDSSYNWKLIRKNIIK